MDDFKKIEYQKRKLKKNLKEIADKLVILHFHCQVEMPNHVELLYQNQYLKREINYLKQNLFINLN